MKKIIKLMLILFVVVSCQNNTTSCNSLSVQKGDEFVFKLLNQNLTDTDYIKIGEKTIYNVSSQRKLSYPSDSVKVPTSSFVKLEVEGKKSIVSSGPSLMAMSYSKALKSVPSIKILDNSKSIITGEIHILFLSDAELCLSENYSNVLQKKN